MNVKMNKNLRLPYSKIIWLHTSWNRLDDSEGVKSITKLVIFHWEPCDQYIHFHMVLTPKWGNSEITLFFSWMGPTVPLKVAGRPQFLLFFWGGGGQQCLHMTHICVGVHTCCHIKYYSYPQQLVALQQRKKCALDYFPSLCLSFSLCDSLFLFVRLSFISLILFLHLCLSLGMSVIPDSLKGLFRLISLTLIYD